MVMLGTIYVICIVLLMVLVMILGFVLAERACNSKYPWSVILVIGGCLLILGVLFTVGGYVIDVFYWDGLDTVSTGSESIVIFY